MSTNSFHSDEIYYFNTHRPLDLVQSLKNRYADFPTNVISEIFQNTLGLSVSNIRPDSNYGTGHVIYFVETNEGVKVFRANIGVEQPEHYMALESEFIKLYAHAGIPVGAILFADCTREKYNFDYQIVELLSGKDLETEWTGTESEYEEICVNMGRLVAKQYQCPTNGWGRFKNEKKLVGNFQTAHEYLMSYVDFDAHVLMENATIKSDCALAMVAHLENSKHLLVDDASYLVHHDLADHNLRYEGSKIVAVFDWENAVSFDPVSELGSAHTWVSHYPNKREKMIEGFLQELGHEPKHLQKKISLYFLRTMLWKVAFALRRGMLTDRHITLLNQALSENDLPKE